MTAYDMVKRARADLDAGEARSRALHAEIAATKLRIEHLLFLIAYGAAYSKEIARQ